MKKIWNPWKISRNYDPFRPEECRLAEIRGKSHVSARQYEKFAEAMLAVTSESIEGSINALLIERSRDAGKRGTTRTLGPSAQWSLVSMAFANL